MRILTLAAVLLLTVALGAQVKVGAGDPAPVFKGKWFNHANTSLEDLEGKVVFLDVWRTWCGPCTAQIPHLNTLSKEYESKGLVVVGITTESKSLVTKHIEKHRMKFPIAIVESDEERNYGITGFPTSLLIDTDGTILWRGHPAAFEREFSENDLEKVLARARVFPEVPSRYGTVKKNIDKGALGKAWIEAEKKLAKDSSIGELVAVQDRIVEMVNSRMEQAAEAMDEEAFGEACLIYEEIVADFSGMAEAEQAATKIDELEADALCAKDIKAAKKFESAMKSWRDGKFDKALKGLRSVAKQFEGTSTAYRAEELIDKHGD